MAPFGAFMPYFLGLGTGTHKTMYRGVKRPFSVALFCRVSGAYTYRVECQQVQNGIYTVLLCIKILKIYAQKRELFRLTFKTKNPKFSIPEKSGKREYKND